MARVDEAFVRPPHFVDADTDIVSVVKLFQDERTTTVLVRDTGVRTPAPGHLYPHRAAAGRPGGAPLDRLPVRELANFSLISVRPSDSLATRSPS